MVPGAHSSPQPRWHVDRFSLFAGFVSVTDSPTYIQIDRATRSASIVGPKYTWNGDVAGQLIMTVVYRCRR